MNQDGVASDLELTTTFNPLLLNKMDNLAEERTRRHYFLEGMTLVDMIPSGMLVLLDMVLELVLQQVPFPYR